MDVVTCCERRGVNLQESFDPQSYGTFEQSDILETIDVFDMVYRTKKSLFLNHAIDIHDEPLRPSLARHDQDVTLFDAVFSVSPKDANFKFYCK